MAQNDGFAVMVNLDNSQTDHPVTTIIRYKGGAKAWTRPVNGPGVHPSEGVSRNESQTFVALTNMRRVAFHLPRYER